MDPGCDPIAYPMTLNASLKLLKPRFFKPSESYFERYKPVNMSFSLVAIRSEFSTMIFNAVGRSANYFSALRTSQAQNWGTILKSHRSRAARCDRSSSSLMHTHNEKP